MRIGLDITQAVKRKGRGIARYIREILPRLADPELGLQPTYCIRSARWWRRSLVAGLQPGTPRAWLPFPFWLSTGGLELFHSFGNHLPSLSSVPLTFTIHDFRALDSPLEKGIGGDRLRRNIERSDGVLCLTEHGRRRLLHHYPDYRPSRLAVVPHGVDRQRFRQRDPQESAAASARLGISQPFFLQLGSWFPHKNLELSIRAFARCRARSEGFTLVFAGGGATPDYAARLLELARSEGAAESVQWIEDVAGDDLPLLLSASAALLQPSRYEGFALPLLEAMAAGVPGVVSDSSCLPEVSGGIWPISGQDDPAAFAAGMDAVTLDQAVRDAAIQAGLERAADFSWERTARRTVEFFRQVLGSAGAGN